MPLQARHGLMEPRLGLQVAKQELQLLHEQAESQETRESQGFKQLLQASGLSALLRLIARTHSSSSEPTGAVRNALLAANLRKEIQDQVLWSFGFVAFCV